MTRVSLIRAGCFDPELWMGRACLTQLCSNPPTPSPKKALADLMQIVRLYRLRRNFSSRVGGLDTLLTAGIRCLG